VKNYRAMNRPKNTRKYSQNSKINFCSQLYPSGIFNQPTIQIRNVDEKPRRSATVKNVVKNVDCDGICAICFCDVDRDDEKEVTNCSHLFHIQCLKKWKNMSKSCPICRTVIE